MAITRASLVGDSSNADATSYVTGSITPTASRLAVACYNSVNLTEAVDPTQPTVSGNGLSWQIVDTFVWRTFGDRYRLTIAAADTGVSPSAGGVTFDHGSQTQEAAEWSIFELNGTDVANGVPECFVQFVHSTVNASGSSLSLTLAAAGAADNRPFLAMAHASSGGITPRADWTEVHEGVSTAPNTAIETQERLDTFETTASATWTGTVGYGGIAFEVKAATGAPSGTATDPFGMTGFFGA